MLNKALDSIRQAEALKLGLNEDLDFNDSLEVNLRRKQLGKQGLSKYYSAFQRFLFISDFHTFSLDTIDFTEAEIDYIIENCIANARYCNIPENEENLFIMSSLLIAMLIKIYTPGVLAKACLSLLQINEQYKPASISEGNELKNDNSTKEENKKIELTWEALLSMISMFVTFCLIPLIPMMGFSTIIMSGLISALCYINWEISIT